MSKDIPLKAQTSTSLIENFGFEQKHYKIGNLKFLKKCFL